MEGDDDDDKGIVCVTGGTGYVASWLIMRLLQHGYTVRTTVRSNPDSKKDICYLTNLPGASERLQIFNADLNHPETFDGVIRGCIGVFHVAHPVSFEENVPEEVTNERAINGTIGILQACLNSKTVKRVVYTSSAFTVLYNDKSSSVMIDESHWTDIDYVRAQKPFGTSYIISKTLAERAALEFAESHGLDLVSLIPPMIIGPFICPGCPGSVCTALAVVLGEEDQYKHLSKTSLVHIDDVASAHIFLLENPVLKGRYICSPLEVTLDQICELLSAKYPEYPVPKADLLKGIEESKYSGLSSKKLLDSGFKFKYGFEDMFDGAIQCCKEKGFI